MLSKQKLMIAQGQKVAIVAGGIAGGSILSGIADGADFRGRIYVYIEKIGVKNIVAELNAHGKLYGERFAPCE